jgi:DNA-binding XRE family transcriptional regulator
MNNLKQWLATQDMTQSDLADLLGYSRKTINAIANGEEPSGDFLWRFFREYGEATTVAVFDTKQEAA